VYLYVLRVLKVLRVLRVLKVLRVLRVLKVLKVLKVLGVLKVLTGRGDTTRRGSDGRKRSMKNNATRMSRMTARIHTLRGRRLEGAVSHFEAAGAG
jgi:hypothetical protein